MVGGRKRSESRVVAHPSTVTKVNSMMEPKVILFVCTGNICRSPMAAALLRARLEADGRAGEYQVLSAGTWADEGRPASHYAQVVMAERGIDLGNHRAREITPQLMQEADLVLVMTRAHRESLCAEFPDAAHKIYLLSEMIGRTYDIADPYSGSLQYYAYCAEELAAILDEGYERILALASQHAADE